MVAKVTTETKVTIATNENMETIATKANKVTMLNTVTKTTMGAKVTMKIAVFWVVAPCSLYQTTRCYNPEDSNLHTHRRENLKSY
jgi:hypothetical protein